MARDSRLFKMYKDSQNGLNVGLTYEGWLESTLQTEDGQLNIPVVMVSVCPDCSSEDTAITRTCLSCGSHWTN